VTDPSDRSIDLVVVGAGVMGAWTALRALDAGHRVLLVDAFGPGDARGTSSDLTRISRASHGTDRFYPAWWRDSLEAWRELGDLAGEPLFVEAGVAWFASREDGFEATSERSLEELGIATERLSPEEARRRWPVVAADDLAFVLHEPGAGILRARRGVRAVTDVLGWRGGRLRVRRVRPGRLGGDRLLDLETDAGERIEADAFVFACGPWLPNLFPELVGGLVSVTKQDVIHLGPAPGDARFDAGHLPVWIDFEAAVYGIPGIDGHGPKIPPDSYGRPWDPDTEDRVVDAASVRTVREYLGRRIPDLASRPVVESRVCQYESTPDTHFILDRHPDLENVWLAGGGSGHAFKHGPEIGRYLVGLISGGTPPNAPPDDRFSITRDRRAGPGVRAGFDSPRPRPIATA
jgi:glycine/D-amino acid oxidase-like deaminating enzyme